MLGRQRLGQLCRWGLKGCLLAGFWLQHPSLGSHVELYPSFFLMLAGPYRGTSVFVDVSKHQCTLHMN